jgi:hypothetical protein
MKRARDHRFADWLLAAFGVWVLLFVLACVIAESIMRYAGQ